MDLLAWSMKYRLTSWCCVIHRFFSWLPQYYGSLLPK